MQIISVLCAVLYGFWEIDCIEAQEHIFVFLRFFLRDVNYSKRILISPLVVDALSFLLPPLDCGTSRSPLVEVASTV